MIRNFALAAVLFMAACATPYDIPAEDSAALAQRITSFEQAFVSGNTTEVINVIPPRLIAAIAAEGGVSEKALRRQMETLTKQATAKVKIVSFGMALDRATFLTTPSGRPYGLIPTQTVVQAPNGQKLQSDNNTLALEDGGKWYLIRIDEGRQMELMREAYPAFQGVTFPQGTSKVIG